MPPTFRCLVALTGAVLGMGGARSVDAQTAFALSNNGNRLISFDVATPGVVTVIGNLHGIVNRLDGMDFRPEDGLLYGYDSLDGVIVTVNTATGKTKFVTGLSNNTFTTNLGIDFNPNSDRLRIVSNLNENLRANVNNGVTLEETPLAYDAGDPNAGVNPNVNDVAYANNDTDPTTPTAVYAIDYRTDSLVRISGANDGTLHTIGALGVNTNSFVGFDIYTAANGNNAAYASLLVNGVESLYSINLSTGAATSLGTIDANRVFGLAIQTLPAAVPEPGNMALLVGLSLTGASFLRKHRKHS